MRTSSRLFLLALVLATGVIPVSARADESSGGAAATMPQRERDLIAIIDDARSQMATNHGPTPAQDARLAMQIKVMSYMRQSQNAQDWVGTVKTRGTTPEGDAWIVIEIAENITIATWQTERNDVNANTLFKPHSKLFQAVKSAKLGQPVIFSGLVLKSVLGQDDQMVLNPQFIARFSAIKVGQ